MACIPLACFHPPAYTIFLLYCNKLSTPKSQLMLLKPGLQEEYAMQVEYAMQEEHASKKSMQCKKSMQ